MVTAILPTLTYGLSSQDEGIPNHIVENGHSHAISPSISSELTITPARLQPEGPSAEDSKSPRLLPSASSSQLAGFVGMFTGLGALIALAFFLPLPAKLQEIGETASQSLANSFYIVAIIALLVALIDFVGLRNLPGEEGKGWKKFFQTRDGKDYGPQTGSAGDQIGTDTKKHSYLQHIIISIKLGFTDSDIGLGYLAGFIARASSIAISLFIPLFVNAYFISSGQCSAPDLPQIRDPDETKQSCRRAYILAAILTGTSQLVALLAAPIYGYLLSRSSRSNSPILVATLMGVFGYTLFGMVRSPDPESDEGTYGIYLLAAMIGLSQIGAIVGSLSLISRGVQKEEDEKMFHEGYSGAAGNPNHSLLGRGSQSLPSQANIFTSDVPQPEWNTTSPSIRVQDQNPCAYNSCVNDRSRVCPSPSLAVSTNSHESQPLLSSTRPSSATRRSISRKELNGSIAGVYSFSGGAGILILTKLGGSLFDSWTSAAPLYFMAIANGVLFIVTIAVSMCRTKALRSKTVEESESQVFNE